LGKEWKIEHLHLNGMTISWDAFGLGLVFNVIFGGGFENRGSPSWNIVGFQSGFESKSGRGRLRLFFFRFGFSDFFVNDISEGVGSEINISGFNISWFNKIRIIRVIRVISFGSFIIFNFSDTFLDSSANVIEEVGDTGSLHDSFTLSLTESHLKAIFQKTGLGTLEGSMQ